MELADVRSRLAFIREAERLKNVLRSAFTSEGRHESTAEHTWRLCLLAMVFEDQLEHLDFGKVLKICVIHDLGEAISGDIPAIAQVDGANKSTQERNDLLRLMRPLDAILRQELLSLWEEYENASSPEAQVVKALDKIETLVQHNQGANPTGFDYEFNLSYGKSHTSANPLFSTIRALVDEDTRERIQRQQPESQR